MQFSLSLLKYQALNLKILFSILSTWHLTVMMMMPVIIQGLPHPLDQYLVQSYSLLFKALNNRLLSFWLLSLVVDFYNCKAIVFVTYVMLLTSVVILFAPCPFPKKEITLVLGLDLEQWKCPYLGKIYCLGIANWSLFVSHWRCAV